MVNTRRLRIVVSGETKYNVSYALSDEWNQERDGGQREGWFLGILSEM